MNNTDLKNKTISGVFWKFGERITAQLITFIVSIVLARIIMPEDYGIIALVTVFITLANVFVTNGLGTSLIQKKDSDDKDFSTMFYASIILSLILYLIIFLVAPFVSKIYKNNLLTPVLRVMGLRIPIAAINSIQHAYVSKKMIYKKFFFATLFGTIVSGIVGIVMAYKGYGVWALVGQYLTNTLIDTIVLFFTLDWKPKLYFSYNKFKSLFSYGWKVMIASFIGTLFDQLKSLIIGIKYKSSDLAYYNRGEQIPSLITNNVNATLETVLFPTIAKIQDEKERLKSAVRTMMKMASFIAFPTLLGLAVVSKPLIHILLTDKWLFCVPYLQVCCVQACFSILGTVNLQSIKGIGKSETLLKLELIKKPIYLILILIGMFIGPLYIAIGNMIYSIIAFFINAFPNKKYLDYPIKNQILDILNVFLISIVMVIIVYFVGLINLPIFSKLILQIFSGIIMYILMSYIFKIDSLNRIISLVVNKGEVHENKRIKKKNK